MRYFGTFLCILRSNVGLSLDELAKLVGTSRSTISRLENDEYPQPFKERLYEQLLKQQETKETELGVGNAPPNLKLKIQEYSNILQEIRKRLDILNSRQSSTEPGTILAAQVHYANSIEGRLVVGHQYGEEFNSISLSSSLYSFASSNARWLMQLANIERFAVDDCIVLTNSRNFAGWEPGDIKTTLLTTAQPIPDNLPNH